MSNPSIPYIKKRVDILVAKEFATIKQIEQSGDMSRGD
jgi:hypothetical protein